MKILIAARYGRKVQLLAAMDSPTSGRRAEQIVAAIKACHFKVENNLQEQQQQKKGGRMADAGESETNISNECISFK